MPRLNRESRLGTRDAAMRRRGTRARRGMTIAEVIVAMVLLGVVGAGIIRIFTKQQQSYRDLSLTAAARRELRLGATVLPSEFRSISTAGGDIAAMDEDELEMRAYLGTGVVCAIDFGPPSRIWVLPTNLTYHTLTSYIATPGVQDTLFIYDENTLKGSEDDRWLKYGVTGVDNDNGACAGTPLAHATQDAPAVKPRRRYVIHGEPGFEQLPPTVQVGTVVRFTRPVRYRIYQEASGSWYLGMQEYTSGAWGATEPLAGPFRPFQSGDANPSGLQFRFYDVNGTRITNMANTGDVTRIDVFLRTNAGASAITERAGAALRDSVVMRVAIRNAQ